MSLSRPVLNLDALVAIDVHTHAETDGRGHYSLPDDMRAAADKYFGAQSGPPDVHQLAAYYRQRNMAAVVFTVDAESTLGHGRLRARNLALCIADSERLSTPVVITADYGYFRLRDEGYTPEDIARWGDVMREKTSACTDVFVYFKHEESGKGPEFGRLLMQHLGLPADVR